MITRYYVDDSDPYLVCEDSGGNMVYYESHINIVEELRLEIERLQLLLNAKSWTILQDF